MRELFAEFVDTKALVSDLETATKQPELWQASERALTVFPGTEQAGGGGGGAAAPSAKRSRTD